MTCERTKHNDKGEIYEYEPFTVGFSYSEYLGKIPIETIIEKLDEVYSQLKRHLVEVLEDD